MVFRLSPLTMNITLKWLSSLPILMQKLFALWQFSARYSFSTPPPPPTHTHTHTSWDLGPRQCFSGESHSTEAEVRKRRLVFATQRNVYLFFEPGFHPCSRSRRRAYRQSAALYLHQRFLLVYRIYRFSSSPGWLILLWALCSCPLPRVHDRVSPWHRFYGPVSPLPHVSMTPCLHNHRVSWPHDPFVSVTIVSPWPHDPFVSITTVSPWPHDPFVSITIVSPWPHVSITTVSPWPHDPFVSITIVSPWPHVSITIVSPWPHDPLSP